tara:strand:+ start:834 stop:1469 length:636 start_codon:yes stop_codon:yes gene_type:complete
MFKTYSAPNFGNPQELPLRWRFADGTVRTDLRQLSDEELILLDWVPVGVPVPTQVDEEGNVLQQGDYDSETHKSVWYSAQRTYIILEKNVDSTPYESGNIVDESIVTVDYVPPIIVPSADWNGFRTALVSSVALNQFVASAMNIAPIAALALPATMLNIETEGFSKFGITWQAITAAVGEVPAGLITEVLSAAEEYHIPFAFTSILQPLGE